MRYVQFGQLARQSVKYHIELEELFYSTADRYGTRKHAPAPIDHQNLLDRRAAKLGSTPKYVDPLGHVKEMPHQDDREMIED